MSFSLVQKNVEEWKLTDGRRAALPRCMNKNPPSVYEILCFWEDSGKFVMHAFKSSAVSRCRNLLSLAPRDSGASGESTNMLILANSGEFD